MLKQVVFCPTYTGTGFLMFLTRWDGHFRSTMTPVGYRWEALSTKSRAESHWCTKAPSKPVFHVQIHVMGSMESMSRHPHLSRSIQIYMKWMHSLFHIQSNTGEYLCLLVHHQGSVHRCIQACRLASSWIFEMISHISKNACQNDESKSTLDAPMRTCIKPSSRSRRAAQYATLRLLRQTFIVSL